MSEARRNTGLPARQGLYDPDQEHDACGLGFVVNIKGQKSHQTVTDALRQTISLVDKMASKGLIHRNTAGRYKSRLATRVTKRTAAA